MKVVALYNAKGGVGKTTAAVNLAHLAAEAGLQTLIWDLDPQGAASYMFRVKPRVRGGGGKLVRGRRSLDDAIKGTDFEGLDLLPADFTYRHMDIDLSDTDRPSQRLSQVLAPAAEEFDLVVLDTPPSISLVTENVLHTSDLVLVPLIPTVLSVRMLEQLTSFADSLEGDHRPRLHAFFSMVDKRKALHRDVIERLTRERDDVGEVTVPYLSLVELMSVRRAPITAFAPKTPAAAAYRALWSEVESLLT